MTVGMCVDLFICVYVYVCVCVYVYVDSTYQLINDAPVLSSMCSWVDRLSQLGSTFVERCTQTCIPTCIHPYRQTHLLLTASLHPVAKSINSVSVNTPTIQSNGQSAQPYIAANHSNSKQCNVTGLLVYAMPPASHSYSQVSKSVSQSASHTVSKLARQSASK